MVSFGYSSAHKSNLNPIQTLDLGAIACELGRIQEIFHAIIYARTELTMRKIWMRLLAGCLALLINWTTTGAVWAANSPKAGDPKFQGVPLQCFVSLADAGTSPEAKVAAYTEIAGKYLELDLLDRSTKVLQKGLAAAKDIPKPSLQAFALLDIAGRLTKASQPKLAIDSLGKSLDIVKELTDPVDKVFATIKIAQAYGEAGDKSSTQKLLIEANKETPEIIDAYVRSRAFAAIANAYTEIGDAANSEGAIAAATDLLPMIEDPNIKTRARVEIAGSYAQAGNHAKAIASLGVVFEEFDQMRDRAIASAKDAADKDAKKSQPSPNANAKVANKNLKNVEPKETKAVPDPKVVEQTATVNAEILKTRSLFLIANQYLVSKQYDKALEVIANLDDQSVEKSVGIANVAISYVKDKNNEKALQLFDQSLQGLTKVTPSSDVFTLLVEVGRQYQILKKTELAKTVWAQALTIAQNFSQPIDRLFAFNIIASNYGEFGLNEPVEPILQESLAIAKTAPDPNIRSRAYSDISSVYWTIGQRAKAKEIAQTVENPAEKLQLEKLFACAT